MRKIFGREKRKLKEKIGENQMSVVEETSVVEEPDKKVVEEKLTEQAVEQSDELRFETEEEYWKKLNAVNERRRRVSQLMWENHKEIYRDSDEREAIRIELENKKDELDDERERIQARKPLSVINKEKGERDKKERQFQKKLEAIRGI